MVTMVAIVTPPSYHVDTMAHYTLINIEMDPDHNEPDVQSPPVL